MKNEQCSNSDLSRPTSDQTPPSSRSGQDAKGRTIRPALVVAGGFFTYFSTFGLLNSFGTFQSYYHLQLLHNYDASTIAWIGSIELFLLFIGGMVIGPAFDAWGARRLFIPGVLIYVVSLMMTSLCTKYYQLILAHGVLFGIRDAMLFYPTISVISGWFDKKKGFALGIVVSGSSLGGICWPLLTQALFDSIGFPWTLRIIGFICLGLLGPAACFIVEEAAGIATTPPVKASLGALFKELRYLTLTAGFFFVFWGMFLPFYYMPTYGVSHGMTTKAANDLLSYLNAASFFGRILSGWLADQIGPLNITIVCASICGVLALGLYGNQAHYSQGGTYAFAVLFGFFSGGLISLQAACVGHTSPDRNTIGLRIGLMLALCSAGALTGSPLGGALLSDEDDWDAFLRFTAGSMLVGSAFLIWTRLRVDRRVGAAH